LKCKAIARSSEPKTALDFQVGAANLWEVSFRSEILRASAGSDESTPHWIPLFQRLQHFPDGGLTNEKRHSPCDPQELVDCKSGPVALYRPP